MTEELLPHLKWDQLLAVTQGTLYMTALSGAATFILGIVPDPALSLTAHGGLLPNRAVYSAISLMISISRSIPLVILIVLLISLTKAMVGTILGVSAALPALIMGAAPLYARLVEITLREVDKDAIEVTCSMGARLSMLIFQVLLPESSPALVSGVTVTLIVLVGCNSMVGVIGAGGLGNSAYLEGFQRNHSNVTLMATVAILLTVFTIQLYDDVITSPLDRH